ncbi:hypothetical protein J7M07_09440 [bacterium]|nr:hypothetical protein [bacterium]
MQSFKGKFGFFIILIITVIACVLFALSLHLWHWTTEKDQKISQVNVLKIIAELEANMTKEQVCQLLKEHEWTSFRDKNGEIRLWTKPQPLPRNWIIRLLFDNNVLIAIKFGTADNISRRPKDAPPDIIFDSMDTKLKTRDSQKAPIKIGRE